jgi:hypothetical protein
MNPQVALFRKVAYLVAIGVLLMPLFWLSHPGTGDTLGAKGQAGGKLAQLRREYKLTQTQLGQIDPTAETIKLATLGMRGIAADILWTKANTYQMKKDWTNLGATLTQISKVQPHFISVWRHQAWNLSYNVSVAFDDYHDKYYWVIEGMKFLQEGVKYNEREPGLLWDLGWFLSHKIGRADEWKQYRRLFREDEDFQKVALPTVGDIAVDDSRDNWQVGKAWFRAVEYMVDTWGLRVNARRDADGNVVSKNPLLVFCDAPMCQMYYGDTLEKEGRFEEVARRAWQKAGKDWYEYGQRELDTYDGKKMHLNDQEAHEEAARKRVEELEKLAPGLRKKIREEKRAELKPDERTALDTPADKRTPQQASWAADAQSRVEVSHEELARRVTGAHRDQARKLAAEAAEHEEMASYVRRERSTVNFDYWRLRARVEQDPETFAARKAVHQGDVAYADNRPTEAKQHYEEGLKGWRKVLDRYPKLQEDRTTGDDLIDVIRDYHKVLSQRDERLPRPFILQDIIDKYGKKQ